MKFQWLVAFIFLVEVVSLAASDGDVSHYRDLEHLKSEKRFGIGVSAGGPLSLAGIEADVNILPEFGITGGIGTGADYSTFTVKGKYYFSGRWVAPYVAAGLARWWSYTNREMRPSPAVLANKFLGPDHNPEEGFSVFMVYPAAGVQIMHSSGVAFFAEFQYLFELFSFSNGTYAGAGVHWYL